VRAAWWPGAAAVRRPPTRPARRAPSRLVAADAGRRGQGGQHPIGERVGQSARPRQGGAKGRPAARPSSRRRARPASRSPLAKPRRRWHRGGPLLPPGGRGVRQEIGPAPGGLLDGAPGPGGGGQGGAAAPWPPPLRRRRRCLPGTRRSRRRPCPRPAPPRPDEAAGERTPSEAAARGGRPGGQRRPRPGARPVLSSALPAGIGRHRPPGGFATGGPEQLGSEHPGFELGKDGHDLVHPAAHRGAAEEDHRSATAATARRTKASPRSPGQHAVADQLLEGVARRVGVQRGEAGAPGVRARIMSRASGPGLRPPRCGRGAGAAPRAPDPAE